MNPSTSKFSLPILLGMLLVTLPLRAQNSGSIQGTVVDQQGAVIAGATVEARDQEKGIVVRVTTTSAEGLFNLQPLQPGIYAVRVRAKGMKELSRPDLRLDSRQVMGLGELQLNLGATNEVITVESRAPLVETATGDHSAVIDSREVQETSLNGRDFQSLVRTLPGVVSNDSSDFRLAFNNTDSFHVNGMRGSDNNVYLDGAINTDVGANDGQFTQLSMDAVGEFKLQTSNFAAEYGRNPGVLLAINTKSGGQQFHGTVYEFNREDGFDANSYFNKFGPYGNALTSPAPKSELRFHQYGFNIGGPIPLGKLSPWNNKKMFFFFNFEGTKALRPSGGSTYLMPNPAFLGIGTPNGDADFSALVTPTANFTPTPLPFVNSTSCPANPVAYQGTVFMPGTLQYDSQNNVICGTPFAGNIVPKSMFSSQYQGWINYLKPFYLANQTSDPANPQEATEYFQDTYHFNKHQEVVRYDWNVNAKTNFFFRWVDDSQREAQKYQLFAWGTFPALPNYRKKPGASWSWNLVNVISPTITNEFVFGYNHLTQIVDVNTTAAHYDKTLLGFTYQDLYPSANTRNLVPEFQADPNTLLSQYFPPTWTSEARAFTWTDNLTKMSGPHTLKFGAFFDYNQAGQSTVWAEGSNFDFTDAIGQACGSTACAGNFGLPSGQGTPSFANTTHYGIANLLLGNYHTIQQSNNKFFGSFRFHQFEIYGQDTWKLNRKLTLDYGLRWAYLGPTYTVKPIFENYFDPAAYNPAQAVTIVTSPTTFAANGQPTSVQGSICTLANSTTTNSAAPECRGLANYGDPYNGMIQEGTHGIPAGFVNHRYSNLQPRLGFAYDPSGNGKWAIRGGFGIFHERVRQNANSFDALGNPPLQITPTIFNSNIDQTGPNLVANGTLTPGYVITPAKDGHIPTTYSWSLGMQHELPSKIGLEVAYVGNQARHLQYQYDLNQFPVGTTTGGATPPPNGIWAAVAKYPAYSKIIYTNYGANSEYNALQIRAIRRFSRGLTLSTDYTYSKNRDLADNDYMGQSVRDAFHPKLDYGPTGWDRPHVFNFNYVYDFPSFSNKGTFVRMLLGGWESSGVIRFWSGSPFSLFCGGNSGTSGGGAGSAGAPFCDYVGGPIYLRRTSTLEWINPTAFQAGNPGTLGNTTRNEFRGPGYQNWNFSLFKNVNFSESRRLQLRLETFNTFNHAQFGGDTGCGSMSDAGVNNGASCGPLFGRIDVARDPRQIQLGAKFYF